MAATAGRVDDALPRHEVEERTLQRAERHAHRPRAARLAEDGGDLPVGDDSTARDAPDHAIDQAVEGWWTGAGCASLLTPAWPDGAGVVHALSRVRGTLRPPGPTVWLLRNLCLTAPGN